MRLDRILSDGLAVSRKTAAEYIRTGRVSVSGSVCKTPDAKISPDDVVLFDGEPVRTGPVYIMMNKPEGVLSATEDKRDKTAADLLPPGYKRLKLGIAGRLDKDSCGLLLLTNDGELNHRLTSPSYECEKVYVALTDRPCGPREVEAFKDGVRLSDHDCRPAVLTPEPGELNMCEIRITEGKYRQIRRMLSSLGIETLSLKRIAIGPLRLDASLEPGAYRMLTPQEADELKKFSKN